MSGQSRGSCGLISNVGREGGGGEEVWLGNMNIFVRWKQKPDDGLVIVDAEERPKCEAGEAGEDNLFGLSSKTRSMTVSGSFSVITLAWRAWVGTSVDAGFETLVPAVSEVWSSSS